ncbi:MAG: tetratricopeptide repeat protein, partial [Sandaracinaceae bacterium]
ELEANAVAAEKVGRLRELGLGAAEIQSVSVTLGLEPSEALDSDAPPSGAVSNPAQLLRSALARIALKLAQDRLTVLAWDGAEHMDEASQGLLDGLVRDTKDSRVAIVLAYRPGFIHRWTDVPSYFELRLGPMSDDDVARLTGTRLAAEEVPLDLLREVTAKSGGNPLYVEEYLKALADAGAIRVMDGRVAYDPRVAEIEVPKTLRGIVSSRLARITPAERHVLQIAAVAQERFSPELLATISEESIEDVIGMLEALEERGLLRKTSSSRSTERAEYDFAHELVGEVLRDGLTLDARRELHEDVAIALEGLYPSRLDELAEKLAHHHREAGNRERAVDYMIRAADRLEAEHALQGSVTALERALELLSQMATPDRDKMIELYKRIGDLAFRSRELESGAERLAAGVDLAEALGRREEVARLSMLRGRLLVNTPGSSEDGRRWLDQAGRIARQLDDQRLLRDAILADAEADMRIGEHARGSTHLAEALALSRSLGDVEAQIRCLVPLALATASDGRAAEALRALEEANELQKDVGDRFTECEMLKMHGLAHFLAGDYEPSLEYSAKARELALEYGFPYEAAVNAHNMGEAYLRLGDYKRAFASLRYSYEVARDHGWEKLQWGNMRVLGFIDATRFGSKEGRSHVVQANEYAAAHGYVWDLIQGRYYLAIIDQGRGDEEEARQALRDVLRLAADHGHRDYVVAAEKGLRALEQGSTLQLPG